MASIERLSVSWATSVLTLKLSLIIGSAGNKICIAAGPKADAAANSTINCFDSDLDLNKIGSEFLITLRWLLSQICLAN